MTAPTIKDLPAAGTPRFATLTAHRLWLIDNARALFDLPLRFGPLTPAPLPPGEGRLVLDGEITLALYKPDSGKTTEQRLGADELCVIIKGVRHKALAPSAKNRLRVNLRPAL